MWVPPPHGPVPRVHPQCAWDPDGPGEGPSHPKLALDSVSEGISTWGSFRTSVSSQLPWLPYSVRNPSLCPGTLPPTRSSRRPSALLPSSQHRTPIHSGSGCLHHCGRPRRRNRASGAASGGGGTVRDSRQSPQYPLTTHTRSPDYKSPPLVSTHQMHYRYI